MAEQLEAILQLQIDQFTSSLQQAAAQVTAFATSMNGALSQSAASFQAQVQQINALADATRKASAVVRTTKKEEASEIVAQERATGQAIMALRRDREAAEKATIAAGVQLQKDFFATTMGLAKEREAAEKRSMDAMVALQKNFFTIAVGLANDRVAAEKRAAAEVLAVWRAAEKEVIAHDAREALRSEQRFRAANARANASAASAINPIGQGPGGALVTQDLFLLQGYVNLTKEAAKESTFFEMTIARIGTSIRTLGGYLAASVILSIPAAIVAWGKAAVDAAMKMESLRASFNAIAGSAAAGAKDLDFVRQVANRVGVDFLTTAQSFKSLEAAARGTKLEGEKIKTLFEQLSGGFRVLGLTSDQAGHALLAVEQMISKGCHGRGTLIRMADGSVKAVENIERGEALMGPDGTPRTVILLARGRESLFRIIPAEGDPFIVNIHHLMRIWNGSGKQTLMLKNYLEHAHPEDCLLLRANAAPVPFTVEPCGDGEFFGFLLTGDHLYLDAQDFEHHNTISAEELRRQLGNAMPGAVSIMARSLNVGTEELMKMMKAGELLAVDVLPKFGNQVQKEFGPGLAQASRTAVATFAKLGNEIREIAVLIGGTLLKALQPAADFITTLLQKAREARELQEKTAAKVAAEVRAGKPIVGFSGTTMELAAGFTEQEAQQAERVVERIIDLRKRLTSAQTMGRPQDALRRQVQEEEESFRQLNTLIEERTKLRKQEDASDVFAGRVSAGKDIADAQARYAKSVKEIVELQKSLPAEMQKINSLAALLPTTYSKAEERLQAVKKVMKEYLDIIEKNEKLLSDPTVKKVLGAGEAEQKRLQDEIDARKEQERLDKEAIAADKRRDAELKTEEEQRAREEARLRDEASIQIAKITLGETEAKLVALDIQVRKMREAKVNETIITETEAAKRVEIYKEEYEKFLQYDKGKFAEVANRVDKQEEIERILASTTAKITKSAVDDYLAAQEAKLKRLQELGAEEVQLEQLKADTIAGAQRLANEETDKLQKEANRESEKTWRELGNTIEGILASTFSSILKGSKNLFEGIRDAFLSLLAKMAADAITRAVIIPVLVQLVGGGGSGGGGLAGAATAFAGTGSVGATGGSTGGFNAAGALGSAGTLLGGGSALSGALGGPTIGGSLFGGFTGTTLSEIPGIAGLVGPESALGATTIGTVLGGIGAGVAVGMITRQLLGMVGVRGMAGSALAGATGGAVAGTIIMPGIGTAIGAIVGALGGVLANIFGGGRDRTPRFDITSMQAGQVEYDEVVGLRITQNFQILSDFHERLGTDYERFIDEMNDSINAMFAQVLSHVSSASPEVQRALVQPLNSAFNSIATLIEEYPAIGGEHFRDQLEQMMRDIGTAFASASGGAVEELLHAVERIDPIIRAFSQIISSLLEDIRELERQQEALNTTLEGHIQTLRESLMSPAEILSARQTEYNNLLTQFEGGDEATRIELAPRIGELANAILELSKAVLNQSFGDLTAVNDAMKKMEEALFTPQQLLVTREVELMRLMTQFRSGTDADRATIAPQIIGLTQEIMALTQSINFLAEQQALMAEFPAQLRAISEALYSPAQSFLSEQEQLAALMRRFRAGTPEEQLALEPQIAALASQIMQRARGGDVLGQDPQLLRQLQSQLLEMMSEVQRVIAAQVRNGVTDAAALRETLERTQAQMMAVLREVQQGLAGNIVNAGAQTIQALHSTAGQIIGTQYTVANGIVTATYTTANGVITAQYSSAGQLISTEHYIGGVLQSSINNTSNTVAGWSNALYGIQAQLIGQVVYARDLAWYSYTQLINALWVEIGIAQHEIQLLVASLSHLETLDATIARALGVLGEMNARLGNPLNVNMNESIGTALQRDAISVAQASLGVQRQTGAAIIAVLSKQAYGLDFGTGFQFGREVIGFQHGGYVPRNQMAYLHAGERVLPEWENRGGGGRSISISVYGGNRDPGQIADLVIQRIEQKSGRLQSSTIQTSRR